MSKPARRQFLKQSAALGLGVGLGSTLAAPAEAAGPGDPAPVPLSRPLAEFVRLKYASHDIGGQMKTIEEDIQYNLEAARALQRIPLTGADEPDFVFIPE